MPALRELSEAARAALLEIATPRQWRRGEGILEEGDHGSRFLLVESGHVKMVRALSSGRSVILSLLGRGDLFGVAAALAGRPCDASFVALSDARCLEFERDGVFALLRRRPELIEELLPALTRQMVECTSCLGELSCFRVEERLAQVLLRLGDETGRVEGDALFVPVRLSRQELADVTGTTIETSIRIMSRWGKSGLVATERDGFRILDLRALRELGSGAGSPPRVQMPSAAGVS